MENSIFYKMNDKENAMMKEIVEITSTDYEIRGDFIPVDSLIGALYELLYQYHGIQEELENLKRDVDENYEVKNFDPYKEYGVSEHDFH